MVLKCSLKGKLSEAMSVRVKSVEEVSGGGQLEEQQGRRH